MEKYILALVFIKLQLDKNILALELNILSLTEKTLALSRFELNREATAKEKAHLQTAKPPPKQGLQKSFSLSSFCPRQKKNKFPTPTPAYLQTNRIKSTAYNMGFAIAGSKVISTTCVHLSTFIY